MFSRTKIGEERYGAFRARTFYHDIHGSADVSHTRSPSQHMSFSAHTSVVASPVSFLQQIYTVDSFVCDGRIVHWPISENTYLPNCPQAFYGVLAPAPSLSEQDERRAREYADVLVSRLVRDYGFDNEFVDVEVIMEENGAKSGGGDGDTTPSCIEINPRMFAQMSDTYALAYEDADTYETLYRVAIDRDAEVSTPRLRKNVRAAANLYIFTTIDGPARESVQFDKLRENPIPGLRLMVRDDDVISTEGWGGTLGLVGFYNTCGESFSAVQNDFEAVLRNVLTDRAYATNPTAMASRELREMALKHDGLVGEGPFEEPQESSA